MAKIPFSSTYPGLSSRNLWINGAMDYWQRGTSFSTPANGAYNADRMAHFYDGAGSAFTISRQAFTIGQTDVPGRPKYFHRIQVTTAGSGGTVRYHRQAVEGVENLSGKTITISFYAKADATRSIYLQAAQVFGTGGSPSSPVNTTGSAFNISTTWTKYKVTLTLPSVAGKTLGTNNNDYTDIQFQLPVNTLMTIDLAMIMVNEGSDAADFVRAGGDLEGELARCQRYFQKSFNVSVTPANGPNGTSFADNSGVYTGIGMRQTAASNVYTDRDLFHIKFHACMRTSPVFTRYGNNLGQWHTYDGPTSSTFVWSNLTTLLLSDSSVILEAALNGGNQSGIIMGHWTADAEL